MSRGRTEFEGEGEGGQQQGQDAASPTTSRVQRRYGALVQALAKQSGQADAPTVANVATAAVENKGAGQPLAQPVRGAVEGQLGVGLGNVRVHSDELSQQSTEAMGARAFAYGSDVFLGPGEQPTNLGLMAHELTHVVQQGAADERGPQCQVEVGATSSPAETQADAVAAQVTGNAPPANLLVEAGELQPGQMLKSQFMRELQTQVTDTADAALGMLWSALGCPYIEQWFNANQGRDAQGLEALARRYSGIARPASARDYIPPILNRVRQGVETWKAGGDVSGDLAAAGMGGAAAAAKELPRDDDGRPVPAAGGEAQRKPSDPAAPLTPESLAADLGEGAPLDGGTASRMGDAFGGESFADVRIHTGEQAAQKAAELDARAFAVGDHIAFGANEYDPGTIEGDAMLAHELAHTVQQRGAGASAEAQRKPVGGESSAHEADADRATGGVLARLWGGIKGAFSTASDNAGPALTSGYQLQRCGPPGREVTTLPDVGQGKWEGQVLGNGTRTMHIMNPSGPGMIESKVSFTATKTLGIFDTEAAAFAIAKTNNEGGGVAIEDGKYVAYAIKANVPSESATTHGPGDITTVKNLTCKPGVLALISTEGLVMRPGTFDPGAAGDQSVSGGQHFADGKLDVYQGYKDAFAGGEGLDSLEDQERLIAVFNSAMRDTALSVLARSEQEVATKQAHFAGGTSAVTGDEIALIKATAREANTLRKQIKAKEGAISSHRFSGSDAEKPMLKPPGYYERLQRLQDEKAALEQQERLAVSKYPMIARADLDDFLAKSDADMLKELHGDCGQILRDIKSTRRNVLDDDLDLWEIQAVVEATLAGLGIRDEAKRKVILDKQRERAKAKTVSQIVITVFSVGFGLAATFLSGGLAAAFAAGAFGLGVYDAIDQTNDYFVKNDAANTALDPNASLLPPELAPHWGWLVVAWVGVGLDAADVVSAVTKIGKTASGVAEAAEELATTGAPKVGMAQSKLAQKLKVAAGAVDPSDALTIANKDAIAGRLGTTIEIDGRIAETEVRVNYTVSKSGEVTISGMTVGAKAAIGDVLAHENVIRLMQRYNGLTGKLRQLWDRMVALAGGVGKGNPFPAGTESWESWNELSKLEELISARTSKLGKGKVTAAEESLIRGDIEFLETEYKFHQDVVERMSLEAGDARGFVAKPGISTKDAVAAGHGLPDVKKAATSITEDDMAKSAYYYRAKDGGGYTLVKKANREGDTLRPKLGPDGEPMIGPDGLPIFEAGELSRAEKAKQLIAGWDEAKRKAFEELAKKYPPPTKVVPIKGMHKTSKTIGELAKSDFETKLTEILVDAFKAEGLGKGLTESAALSEALTKASDAVESVLTHNVTVVKGTDQLRAYGYRANFARKTGTKTEDIDDLHHLIPLYLGGHHGIDNLVNVNKALHDRLHALIDEIKFDEATSLAPSSIRGLDAAFTEGAAVLKADGTVELVSLP